jgi:hypothetical protein
VALSRRREYGTARSKLLRPHPRLPILSRADEFGQFVFPADYTRAQLRMIQIHPRLALSLTTRRDLNFTSVVNLPVNRPGSISWSTPFGTAAHPPSARRLTPQKPHFEETHLTTHHVLSYTDGLVECGPRCERGSAIRATFVLFSTDVWASRPPLYRHRCEDACWAADKKE